MGPWCCFRVLVVCMQPTHHNCREDKPWTITRTTLVGVGVIQLIECDGNCVQILLVLGVLACCSLSI